MGGRPPVAGLRAVAVAIMLAALPCGAVLAEQISTPLPGTFGKPKPVKQVKHPFRPTMPVRNPLRPITEPTQDAGVTPAGDNETAVASAAGVTAAAAFAAEAGEDAPTPSSDVVGVPSEGDTTATANETQASEAADEPADTTETAETDAAPPSGDGDSDAGATAAPDTDDAAAASDEPAASEESEATEEASPSDDASKPDAADIADAVTNEDRPAPTDETETAAAAAADPAKDEGASPPAPEPAVTPQTAHAGSSVTLTIVPPPEPTSAIPVEDVTPASSEPSQPAATESPEPPMQTAALTPPSEPAPTAAKTEEDEAEIAAATPTEEGSPEAEATEPAAAVLDAAPDPAARADTAAETPETEEAAPALDGTESAASDSAADAEQPATEPAPPPAHPIVAEVRNRLADPEFQKSVDPADLKGLEAFYNTLSGPPLWVTEEGFSSSAQSFIAGIEKADDWGLDARAFHLPPPNDLLATQNAQVDDELILSAALLKYARHAQGGRRTPSKISPLFDQRPPIQDANTVLTEAGAAADPAAYLASLHPQHEQFKRLREALLKAREKAEASSKDPNTDRDVQLITINMERWRWMPRTLGAYHLWNNIPEFTARVVKGGKTVYSEKIIVGQLKYATTFFSAPMRTIVVHPDWTVPPTILKEDLAPRLQGDGGFFGNANTTILRQHNLRVSLNGQPVNPDSVDWRNAKIWQYTFTQPPGPANVLGRFKFNFPNRHAIYMHDTPQRELFAERVPTLSHGCLRIREPERLAALLLAEDKGWSASRVQSVLAGGTTSVIKLNRLVPVHLTYFTAVVAEDGSLEKLDDIYGIDNRMAASLFKKPVRFEVPAAPAIADAGGPQGRDSRRESGGGGGLDDLISGLFGN